MQLNFLSACAITIKSVADDKTYVMSLMHIINISIWYTIKVRATVICKLYAKINDLLIGNLIHSTWNELYQINKLLSAMYCDVHEILLTDSEHSD